MCSGSFLYYDENGLFFDETSKFVVKTICSFSKCLGACKISHKANCRHGVVSFAFSSSSSLYLKHLRYKIQRPLKNGLGVFCYCQIISHHKCFAASGIEAEEIFFERKYRTDKNSQSFFSVEIELERSKK